jgi:hypothetical protein
MSLPFVPGIQMIRYPISFFIANCLFAVDRLGWDADFPPQEIRKNS